MVECVSLERVPNVSLIVRKGTTAPHKQQAKQCSITLVIKDFTVKLKQESRPRPEITVLKLIIVPRVQVSMTTPLIPLTTQIGRMMRPQDVLEAQATTNKIQSRICCSVALTTSLN